LSLQVSRALHESPNGRVAVSVTAESRRHFVPFQLQGLSKPYPPTQALVTFVSVCSHLNAPVAASKHPRLALCLTFSSHRPVRMDILPHFEPVRPFKKNRDRGMGPPIASRSRQVRMPWTHSRLPSVRISSRDGPLGLREAPPGARWVLLLTCVGGGPIRKPSGYFCMVRCRSHKSHLSDGEMNMRHISGPASCNRQGIENTIVIIQQIPFAFRP
jgi:hypothetical protein